MAKRKYCLGYGDTEGKCLNEPNRPRSLYWCIECDKIRMDTISEQLNQLYREII